ncbi:MAG: hypothetical protein HKN61_09415 [Flavobacteriaceae bacterium]|nr:hypothetical protein [Flavobacteriaceae bacterium]
MHRNDNSDKSGLRFKEIPRLNGILGFQRQLEKDYFSKVSVRNYQQQADDFNLVIGMQCNMDLADILYHLDHESWGAKIPDGSRNSSQSPFRQALQDLNACNSELIDIEEFSIFLNDTAIVVKSIYPQSIVSNLDLILEALGNHYLDIISQMNEVPYEIYIPVFEEAIDQELYLPKATGDMPDFLSYWAMYSENEEDAFIYDLKRRCMISGELYMLNQ